MSDSADAKIARLEEENKRLTLENKRLRDEWTMAMAFFADIDATLRLENRDTTDSKIKRLMQENKFLAQLLVRTTQRYA